MKKLLTFPWPITCSKSNLRKCLVTMLAVVCLSSALARVGGPLAAKVKVTTLQSYKGTGPLPKPDKILVYDFPVSSDGVQVDKLQKMRPRHLIAGDENADAIANKAAKNFSKELMEKLAKTGLPVEHGAADAVPSVNALVVQGSFLSLREGNKTERVAVGMGTGSAEVHANVDVRLKTAAEAVLVSQFSTETTPAKNVGAGVPMAAGMNPAAVATKSVVTDRKKTLNRYVSKTADATAGEITKLMVQQGWIKLDAKGQVSQ